MDVVTLNSQRYYQPPMVPFIYHSYCSAFEVTAEIDQTTTSC